jgi:hypothetical protein
MAAKTMDHRKSVLPRRLKKICPFDRAAGVVTGASAMG